MESKYDQLTQLKALLDAGVLSQEEFEAAKRRILESEYVLEQPTPDLQLTLTSNKPITPDSQGNIKWIVFGVVSVIVIILIVVIVAIATSGNNDGTNGQIASDAYKEEIVAPSDEDQIVELEGNHTDYPDDMSEQGDILNPWRLDYFKNDRGDTTSPMIYAVLSGTAWDIHIDYHQNHGAGTFRIYIEDDEGHKEDMYAPVNILVRGSDGETRIVEVTGVRNGIVFIEDPATVEGLSMYLNNDNFDILMEFSKYNERHSTKARWESAHGCFKSAIDKWLK